MHWRAVSEALSPVSVQELTQVQASNRIPIPEGHRLVELSLVNEPKALSHRQTEFASQDCLAAYGWGLS